MIPVPVSISWNFTFGALTHNFLMPPAVVVPAPVPSVEMICTENWPPGKAMNKHKLTTTVQHRKQQIAQDGHDCGPFILDITIPPANLYYAVMYPFSSRQFMCSASTVKMNGAATACVHLFLPKITCGDPISAPTAFPVPSLFNNVIVGMTLGDLLAGLAKALIAAALDAIFEKMGGGNIFGKDMKAVTKGAMGNSALKKALSTSVKEDLKVVAKKALGSELAKKFYSEKGLQKSTINKLANFAVDSLHRLSGNENVDPSLKVSVGNDYLGVELSTNPWSGKDAAQVNVMENQYGAESTPPKGDNPGGWAPTGGAFGKPQ